jgi:hypothetical protein
MEAPLSTSPLSSVWAIWRAFRSEPSSQLITTTYWTAINALLTRERQLQKALAGPPLPSAKALWTLNTTLKKFSGRVQVRPDLVVVGMPIAFEFFTWTALQFHLNFILFLPGREDNFSLDDILKEVQEDQDFQTFSGAESMRFFVPQTVADGWKLFEKTPILKVHGSVNDPSSIILSHGGYKRLLHETVGYKNFMLSLMATNTILYMGFSFNDEYPSFLHPSINISLNHGIWITTPYRYLNEYRSEVLSMLRPRNFFPSGPLQPGDNPLPRPSQPIAYGICADFSYGKQKFYEKHEGVKIMSWSTTKEKSRMLLPSVSGTPKSADSSPMASSPMTTPSRASSAVNSDIPESLDPPSRAQSGLQSSKPVEGGWYSGLEVYLFRILTETSMSVGWGRMLRNKRVSAVLFW